MSNKYYPQILIDTGILVAFYNVNDKYHNQVIKFFSECRSQLITSVACVTEVMWLLSPTIKVQNEFWRWYMRNALVKNWHTLIF